MIMAHFGAILHILKLSKKGRIAVIYFFAIKPPGEYIYLTFDNTKLNKMLVLEKV